MNNFVVLITPERKRLYFTSLRPFVEKWGLTDHNTNIVIRSRGAHGPFLIEQFSIETGKLLQEFNGSLHLGDTPDWAKTWCDEADAEQGAAANRYPPLLSTLPVPVTLPAVATLLVSSPVLFGADASAQDQGIFQKIISAIEKSDYESFVADGDAAFEKLTKAQFESVASQLSSRFKSGYGVTYLGELKQKGFRVTLWKLSFEDGKDDALATLSAKDGKAGGFWIK